MRLKRKTVGVGSYAVIGVATAVMLVSVTSCAMRRHREQIRQGLLTQGLHRDAFLKEWGLPTKTSTIAGDDTTRVGWGSGSGFFFRGRAVYDVWEYRDRGVELVFEGLRLVTWKTDKTVPELRSRRLR